MYNKPITNPGQSLFEVIFALGIAALILLAIVSLATRSVANSTFSRNNALASKYVQEGTECLREQRDTALRSGGWSTFKAQATGSNRCISGTPPNCINGSGICPISGTPFNRRADFKTNVHPEGEEIQATVIVEWSDTQGTHQVRSITSFTNWNR